MIPCSICKEKFAPIPETQKEFCPKCAEANDKKPQISRLAPRLGQRHAMPFDRGVARTISYSDKIDKTKKPEESSKPNCSEKSNNSE
jgi:hypothetical protein